MVSVADRIKQAEACEVIDLDEEEKNIYCGCGWKLARFENGRLVGFFDPLDVPWRNSVQAMAEEAMEAAIAWLESVQGEVWLVMCSCYSLCDPRRVTLTDVSALARMGRVFAEQFSEL